MFPTDSSSLNFTYMISSLVLHLNTILVLLVVGGKGSLPLSGPQAIGKNIEICKDLNRFIKESDAFRHVLPSSDLVVAVTMVT